LGGHLLGAAGTRISFFGRHVIVQIVPFDLPERCSVLVTGAGGGFDFVCGLPIALELEARGHTAHIGSYSFSQLNEVQGGTWHGDHLLEVTADSTCEGDYFPERHLAQWFREARGGERSIWCFTKDAVGPTTDSYRKLVERFDVHAVICVDGGVDGIFRGDETDLGTPSMDSVSVLATHLCKAPRRIYASTGFGTEGAEGTVSHAQALERMADLTALDAALGVGNIVRNSPVGREFIEAVDFIFRRMSPIRRSIMVSSLLASIRGAYGRTVVHAKTRDRPPWISPLTSLYWYFEADAVAKMKLFYEEALSAPSLGEFAEAIERARGRAGVKPFESIPI
jgi:hypothetical protein